MKKITFFTLCIASISLCMAQDLCEEALGVDFGTYSVGGIDAEPAPENCINLFNNGEAGEWYKFVPQQDYYLEISTDLAVNTGKDTRFHVYVGNCDDLTCLGGDEDSGNNLLSKFHFNATQGTTYFIVFDNKWSSEGFDFEISEYVAPETLIAFEASVINPMPPGNTLGAVDMTGDFLDDIVSIAADNVNILEQTTPGTFNEIKKLKKLQNIN